MHMPYKLLDEITCGFSEEIGRGTFGVVYKGVDKAGQEIAVKVLCQQFTDIDGNAFRKELDNLSKLKHPNIVRLVGFCNEEEQVVTKFDGKEILATKLHRALCFEYLKNGSLENHLNDEPQKFDWQKRYIIIKGICMGLKYLHTGLESPVLHFDLKPDNILLGDNMVPKIADFGLARLLGDETSIGTLGYCPPEFIDYRIISQEFDIFSLGVIIIKIICGPAAHSLGDDKIKTRKFIRQVQKKWRERLQAIPGYTSFNVECQCKLVKKCIEIALNCAITDRQQRPTIEDIVDQLAQTEKHINDEANSMKEVLRRWRHRWIKSSKHTPLGYQQVTKCLELAKRCIQINPTDRPDIVYIMDELNTLDSKDSQFQEIPCLDDMLWIKPLEIHFPFELDSPISHSIELTNDTDDYIAFMTRASLHCFQIEPDKGVVPPRSKCSVTATMQAQVNALLNNHYKEEITVVSTKVDGGVAAMDITRDVFIEKEGTVVDEVNVMVVFDKSPSADEES